MRRIKFLIPLFLILWSGSAFAALTDNLISYWKLDEASGNALDVHGSNELTQNGTVGSATGKVSNARDFSENNYFTRADNASLSTGDIDFSLAAWIKFDALAGGDMTVFTKDSGPAAEYYLQLEGSTNRFKWYVYGATGYGSATSVQADTFGNVSTGVWYHVVCWHDSVGNQIGISVNRSTDTASHSAGGIDGGDTFHLGADPYAQEVDGLIDEVGFWKKVLTANEREDLYNDGHGLAYTDFGKPDDPGAELDDANLKTYWPLDEASGNALDSHGTNDLTETGGTIASAAGKVGNARDFESGDSEWFERADNADLSTGDIDFTIAGWLYMESAPDYAIAASKWDHGGSQKEWALALQSGAGKKLNFTVSADGSANTTSLDTTSNLSTATWYFYTAWHDSILNQIAISINAATPVTASHATGVFNGTSAFNLGAAVGLQADGNALWDGLLDETFFIKRRIYPWERRYLYNSGSGRTYSDFAGSDAPMIKTCFDYKTKLMIHGDGADGATAITDSSKHAHSITANGNAQIDTAQAKFGNGSLVFDGTGDYASIPDSPVWDLGTSNFNINYWVRFNSTSNRQDMISRASGDINLIKSSAGNFQILLEGALVFNQAWGPSTNTWYHVAVARSGTDLRVFIDGAQLGSTVTDSTNVTGTGALLIGINDDLSSVPFNGWLDEIQIISGSAVTEADFTVADKPYKSCQRKAMFY